MSYWHIYFLLYFIPVFHGNGGIWGCIAFFFPFLFVLFFRLGASGIDDPIPLYAVRAAILIGGSIELILLTLCLVCCFSPSRSQILEIYGIHYATNSQTIKNLPQNALNLLNLEIQKEIKK